MSGSGHTGPQSRSVQNEGTSHSPRRRPFPGRDRLAQAETPRGTASATVGGKKVTIDYGRPALKGRSIDELLKQLPEDRMWRAGENQVTTLTTEGDITIGGKS